MYNDDEKYKEVSFIKNLLFEQGYSQNDLDKANIRVWDYIEPNLNKNGGYDCFKVTKDIMSMIHHGVVL